MNSGDIVIRYQERELEALNPHKATLRSHGKVTSFRDLYPELIDVPEHSIAYCRGLTPLQFLLLLYDKVVIHIPPLSQEIIENRYGLSLDSIWQLIEGGVILPVINNPADYTKPHLVEFLERQTPSVWTRGVDALFTLGLGDTLDEASCPLPVAEMASVPKLVKRFTGRYPDLSKSELHSKIKGDILVNYADLCIFGFQEFADSLGQLNEPEKSLDQLYLFSELITYPHLFGFGGTANYDNISVLKDVEFLPIDYKRYVDTETLVQVEPKTAERLLRAIGIEMTDLTWREIADFHASGDGEKLRQAMTHFEDVARAVDPHLNHPERIIQYQSELDEQIQKATRLLSNPRVLSGLRSNPQRTMMLRVGAAAVGGLAGFVFAAGSLAVAGIGAVVASIAPVLIEELLPEGIRQRLTATERNHLRNPAIANLWSIREG